MKTERLLTNFSAGPAALPTTMVQRFADEFSKYNEHGISIAECSHRSTMYQDLHFKTIEKIRRVLAVPAEYEVLLLAGGATLQFASIAYNFGTNEHTAKTHTKAKGDTPLTAGAAYCISGAWGKKALESARCVSVHPLAPPLPPPTVVYDGADNHYTQLPQWSDLKYDLATPYLHITSNETINGLQFKQWPSNTEDMPPIIADMSSDIASKPIPVSRFALIYASAQKNIGIAGVTVVIIRRSFLERATETLPPYLSYKNHTKANSLYNTPPTVAVFSINLMMDWIIEQGGVIEMNARNLKKASLLYSYLDEHRNFYHNPVTNPLDRSLVNVIFTLPNEKLTQDFLNTAKQKNIIGIAGHRSVGGCRVSLYNAVELRAVEKLIDMMSEFYRTHR